MERDIRGQRGWYITDEERRDLIKARWFSQLTCLLLVVHLIMTILFYNTHINRLYETKRWLQEQNQEQEPMKRTRIKQQRDKPRPWEDEEFRQNYIASNPVDEIATYFPFLSGRNRSVHFLSVSGAGVGVTHAVSMHAPASQCHHIGSGILGSRRWDEETNLINLSLHTHRWVEGYVPEGLVLCGFRKILKGEWDGKRMAEIMGIPSVADWLGTKDMRFAWLTEMKKRVMEAS